MYHFCSLVLALGLLLLVVIKASAFSVDANSLFDLWIDYHLFVRDNTAINLKESINQGHQVVSLFFTHVFGRVPVSLLLVDGQELFGENIPRFDHEPFGIFKEE